MLQKKIHLFTLHTQSFKQIHFLFTAILYAMKERVQIIWRIYHSYYWNKHCSIKGSILNYVLEMQWNNRNHIYENTKSYFLHGNVLRILNCLDNHVLLSKYVEKFPVFLYDYVC